jgi:hypothetical protein
MAGRKVDGSPSLSLEVSVSVSVSRSLVFLCRSAEERYTCFCSGDDGCGCGLKRRLEQPGGIPDKEVQRAERRCSTDLKHRQRLHQLGPGDRSHRRRRRLRMLPYRRGLHGVLRPGQ